jgi:hypothetical protein
MQALWISREACREFALRYSWENSARQFIGHAQKVAVGPAHRPEATIAPTEPVPHRDEQSLVPGCNTRITHEHSV